MYVCVCCGVASPVMEFIGSADSDQPVVTGLNKAHILCFVQKMWMYYLENAACLVSMLQSRLWTIACPTTWSSSKPNLDISLLFFLQKCKHKLFESHLRSQFHKNALHLEGCTVIAIVVCWSNGGQGGHSFTAEWTWDDKIGHLGPERVLIHT